MTAAAAEDRGQGTGASVARRTALLFLVVSCLLSPASWSQADPAPAAPAASVRDVIYFGPAGPVRIRLRVSLDGRPADAVWNKAVESLFAYRDRNGDGVLDTQERAAFTAPTRPPRDIDVLGDGSVPPLRLTFPAREEKTSRAAFAEALRTAGQGAVALRVVAARADSRQLSAALFRHLDQNGDGRLSADELRAARDRLAVLDVDEDEFITAAELLSQAVGASGRRDRTVVLRPRQPDEPTDSAADLLFLTADGAQVVKQLLAARGGNRATALKASEFGTDAKAFAVLDKDGNGKLDTAELAAWLSQPPELELAVAFTPTTGRLTPTGTHRVEPNGSVAAAVPGGRFRFDPPDAGASLTSAWEKAADRLRAQFNELGRNSPVERRQLDRQPAVLPLFELADRDGTGRVARADAEAALKAVAPLARCRVEVVFADHGSGLFELLDRNGDGRLSPRELVEAVAVLNSFAGPDGTLGPADIVRRFRVRTAVESIPVGVLVPPTRAPIAAESSAPAGVPAWFVKMDRNGDGDVSLREFVGPIELFRKLDRNGDGLISADEAAAAGK